MPVIYSIQSHEQALLILQRARIRNAKIVHVDFHCDMRGLLIDRKKQRAYRIWDRFWRLNEGNFLTHAICEGVVSRVRWIHDEPGGRQDDFKIVKYESDVSAMPHRLILALRGDQGIPIQFEVMTSDQWNGIQSDEVLDIDWDYFAAAEYEKSSIQERVDRFLSREFESIPTWTFVSFSPEYCHSSEQQFTNFVEALASKFGAEITNVPIPKKSTSSSMLQKVMGRTYRPARNFYRNFWLAMHKRGIY